MTEKSEEGETVCLNDLLDALWEIHNRSMTQTLHSDMTSYMLFPDKITEITRPLLKKLGRI